MSGATVPFNAITLLYKVLQSLLYMGRDCGCMTVCVCVRARVRACVLACVCHFSENFQSEKIIILSTHVTGYTMFTFIVTTI